MKFTMQDSLLTRASLIARLGDAGDRAAWRQFVDLYGTLIYSFARQRGLQDADAADLTQEVLLAVSKTVGRFQYDPSRGTFRGWLYRITRNIIARFLQDRRIRPIGSGDSEANHRLAEEVSTDSQHDELWEKEYQQQLFRLAAEQIRPRFAPTTWRAFWATAVEGKKGAEVAAQLGLTIGAVYVARSRVLARITEQIHRVESD
jgi:RNA polymerase sigma factor (sigma-70 family)